MDGGSADAGVPVLPAPQVQVPLAGVEDLDPDPHVLEVSLQARWEGIEIHPGVVSQMMTYNGVVPGPLLRLAAGDTLRVHFHNALDEPTTIHWHGLRVPNAMDGAPGHPLPPVGPGERFEYEFVTPDPGLFWYHPHVDSSAQVGAGLYGALVVDDPQPNAQQTPPSLVAVLSDVDLDANGQLVPGHAGGIVADLFGREGKDILVNGLVAPELRVATGQRLWLRLINAARARYMQLELDGTSFTRVGGDRGLWSEPVTSDRLLIFPGERAEAVVIPNGPVDRVLELRWIPYDRGYGSTEFRDPEVMMRLRLVAPSGGPAPEPLPYGPAITPLDPQGALPVDVAFTLVQPDGGPPELGINGLPSPNVPHVQARVGQTQLWTVSNQTDWAHPFHLHGFFFHTVDDSGMALQPLVWRDTADVPARQQIRFLVQYDNRPGYWMYHCHILDHAEAGMMALVHLEP